MAEDAYVLFMMERDSVNIRLVLACDRNGVVSYDGKRIISKHTDADSILLQMTNCGLLFMDEQMFMDMGMKPIPNRINIVCSDHPLDLLEKFQKEKPVEGYWCRKHATALHLCRYEEPSTILGIVHDIDEAFRYCQFYAMHEMWMIGSENVFTRYWKMAKSKVCTIYDTDFIADHHGLLTQQEPLKLNKFGHIANFDWLMKIEAERCSELYDGTYLMPDETSIKWRTLASVSNRGHHGVLN